jgi:hypothetical protein
MRWGEHVEQMGAMRNEYKVLVGKPEGKRPLESSRHSGRILLKCILEKWGGRMRTGLIWYRIGTSSGLLCRQLPNLLIP